MSKLYLANVPDEVWEIESDRHIEGAQAEEIQAQADIDVSFCGGTYVVTPADGTKKFLIDQADLPWHLKAQYREMTRIIEEKMGRQDLTIVVR